MNITNGNTQIKGPKLFKPKVNPDERGFFLETFRQSEVNKIFVQHNHSRSSKNVLRGLHFQAFPGQAKLVRCSRGKIFDVAVDLRKRSKTFGQWLGYVLDDEQHWQLYIPEGFAHGFCVLSDVADVNYLVSTYYNPHTEKLLKWNDPEVNIDWPVKENAIISERDENAPLLKDIKGEIRFD